MSDFFYDPNQAWNPVYWAYNEPLQATTAAGHAQPLQPAFSAPSSENFFVQQLPYNVPVANNATYHGYPPIQQPRWHQAPLASFDQFQISANQQCVQYPSQATQVYPTPGPSIAAPSPNVLTPDPVVRPRIPRNDSRVSNRSSTLDQASTEVSRSVSPSARAIADYGYKNSDGTWSCAWPGCTSRSRFTRACDLRKHYKRHSKTLFCRQHGCAQSTVGGFSSKKDRARHEAKHNPMITCEWDGCGRLFSRVDNMITYEEYTNDARRLDDDSLLPLESAEDDFTRSPFRLESKRQKMTHTQTLQRQRMRSVDLKKTPTHKKPTLWYQQRIATDSEAV